MNTLNKILEELQKIAEQLDHLIAYKNGSVSSATFFNEPQKTSITKTGMIAIRASIETAINEIVALSDKLNGVNNNVTTHKTN